MEGYLVGPASVILVIWALGSGGSHADLVWEWLTCEHLLECLMLYDRDGSVSSGMEWRGLARSRDAQLTWKPIGSGGQGAMSLMINMVFHHGSY